MFTKQHYEKIARRIYTLGNDTANDAMARDTVRNLVAYKLADMFGEDNPSFDRSRFLTACRFGAGARVVK